MIPRSGEVFAFHAFMGLMCALAFFASMFFSFDFAFMVLVRGLFLLASIYHFIVVFLVVRLLVRGEE